MKFQQKLTFDFPPEVTSKYMTDEKALKYIADKHPDISSIEVLENRLDGDKQIISMKYTTEVSLPGPIKKVMGGAAAQSMVKKFVIDTKTNTGTMEVQPSQMADKIKVGAKVSSKQQGDKWVQQIDGDATVKIFGVGKVMEKFLVEKIQSSSEVETRLRNEYMRNAEKA